MSDDNRLFRWLGRVNAILFFFGAVGAIVVAISLMGGEAPMSRHRSNDTAAGTGSGEIYQFGDSIVEPTAKIGSSAITRLAGTDEGLMTLQRAGRSASFSERGSELVEVNLLLVDLTTMKNRWLFAGVKRDIARSLQVRAVVPVPQNSPDPVVALLLPVAAADTDGDGTIAPSDDHALYLYRLGSAAPVKLLDAKSILGMEQLDSGRILITYYDGKTDRGMMLSAKDFTPLADTAIPPAPK